MSERSLSVIKVGGSLFSHPNFGPGLRAWLTRRSEERIVLVPGGAGLADAIRDFHRVHHLSQEICHWLALRALTINAHFLAALLPDAVVISDIHPPPEPRLVILDPFKFAVADEHRSEPLEHSWRVTSDSIAARVALVAKACRLILLKSCAFEPFEGWDRAAEAGWVDAAFPTLSPLLAQINCPIEVFNPRSEFGPELKIGH